MRDQSLFLKPSHNICLFCQYATGLRAVPISHRRRLVTRQSRRGLQTSTRLSKPPQEATEKYSRPVDDGLPVARPTTSADERARGALAANRDAVEAESRRVEQEESLRRAEYNAQRSSLSIFGKYGEDQNKRFDAARSIESQTMDRVRGATSVDDHIEAMRSGGRGGGLDFRLDARRDPPPARKGYVNTKDDDTSAGLFGIPSKVSKPMAEPSRASGLSNVIKPQATSRSQTVSNLDSPFGKSRRTSKEAMSRTDIAASGRSGGHKRIDMRAIMPPRADIAASDRSGTIERIDSQAMTPPRADIAASDRSYTIKRIDLETIKPKVEAAVKPAVKFPGWGTKVQEPPTVAQSAWGNSPLPPKPNTDSRSPDKATTPSPEDASGLRSEEDADHASMQTSSESTPETRKDLSAQTFLLSSQLGTPLIDSAQSDGEPSNDPRSNQPKTTATMPEPLSTHADVQTESLASDSSVSASPEARAADNDPEPLTRTGPATMSSSTSLENNNSEDARSVSEAQPARPTLSKAETDARNELAKAFAASVEEDERRAREKQAKEASRFRIRPTVQDNAPYKPYDPKVSSEWQIFKKASSTALPREEKPAQGDNVSLEDIDRKFELHRQQRMSTDRPFDIDSLPFARRSRQNIEPDQRVCHRCNKTGHIAQFCPQPTKSPRHDPKDGDTVGVSVRNVISDNPWDDGAHPSAITDAPKPAKSTSRTKAADVESEPTKSIFRTEAADLEFAPNRSIFRTEAADVESEPTKSKFRTEAADVESEPVVQKPRLSSRFVGGDEEDEDLPVKRRGGRSKRNEEDDEEDGSSTRRRGRRGRNEDDAEQDFEARQERNRVRESRKAKAVKEAQRRAARLSRKRDEMSKIRLPDFVTVARLAQALNIRYEQFVKKLDKLGFESPSHDLVLSADEASMIAMEYDFDASFGDVDQHEKEERDLRPRSAPTDPSVLPTRPSVVTIMGHVDHGKTTILDYLRKSSVAASEHGGITQHIGAFSVPLSNGKTITFLDTPGHAAFLSMRQRGANVTDIVILVVAADDSVKPQTLEALKHARDANVPIIIAINKVDKEEADVQRVKQDLARHGIEIEDFGGDTQVVCVSGKTGHGMDELEEAASTLSEILDHRAETDGPAEGWIIEATTEKAGRVATVLVKKGTLKPGDVLVAGTTWTRVRVLRDAAGNEVHSAGPGTPVKVDGWRDQPEAGDQVLEAPTEQKATDVVDFRLEQEERVDMAKDIAAINEARRETHEQRATAAASHGKDEDVVAEKQPYEDEDKPLAHQAVPFIIKADVSGSVEAVEAYILQMSNPLCSPRILRSGVGNVSEFDIEHAAAANGNIVAFNLPQDSNTVGEAERRGVKVIEQNIIYRIVDDVKAVLEAKLPPLHTRSVTGEADVAMAFDIGVGGRRKIRIAGCKIRNGTIARGSRVKVLRNGAKVYDGVVTSLKNVKKDVTEMRKGTECGMGFDGWAAFEEGDQIQTYDVKVEKRTLQI